MSLVGVRRLCLFSLFLCVGRVSCETAFVTYDFEQQIYSIHQSAPETQWIAEAHFVNRINQTGWSYLSVKTNEKYSDLMQAYAAGLAEGYLSSELIKLSKLNSWANFCEAPLSANCSKLKSFLQNNMNWMLQEVKLKANSDPYWHMVNLFLIQVKGLQDAFNSHVTTEIDVFGLYLLQIGSDIEDIKNILNLGKTKPQDSGSCSALVKLLPGNQDLYVGHDTWSGYETMLKTLKKYDFAYHIIPNSNRVVPGQIITFSSYPGALLSTDDFYLISSGLVAMETTIANYNPLLWERIMPVGSILEGIRNMVANRLSASGDNWASIFSMYNSGTYNNQWMIVDYKYFTPGSLLPTKKLLTVLEQLPGFIMFKDLTALLKNQTYWASYNIPYFPEVQRRSNLKKMVEKYGDFFSYKYTPRAKIMYRDHVKVKDLSSMIQLMRYNDYKHDPLSQCNCTPPYSAENAISARSDLNPINGIYEVPSLGHRSHGGTDMKVTNSKMFQKLSFVAIAGPTYDQQPPFQWSLSDFEKTVSHVGHPDIFKFSPVLFNGTILTN